MNVWHGLERYPAASGPIVATLGNYDGVHLGHQAILGAVIHDAHRRALPSVLISFEPHPLEVVAPDRRPRLLQTLRQKIVCLARTGIDALLLVRFDRELALLDGTAFFDRLSSAGVRLAAAHVGGNFRFGHDRHGDHELLSRIGAAAGFDVHLVDPVTLDGASVSSSRVRAAVRAGDVLGARKMLGRPYAVEGRIARGAGRGALLHCRTANLDTLNELLPARGVYVTETAVLAGNHPSVTNVGVRPTFGAAERELVEAHLIDYDGDLYDAPAEVRFLARLRDERRFDGAHELAEQLARDRAAALAWFEHADVPQG